MRLQILLIATALAGCHRGPSPGLSPVEYEGYVHVRTSGIVRCTAQPVAVDSDRSDVTLEGACSRVVRGSHNDVMAYVVPGATLDIIGAHNDVSWQLVGAGPPPRLVDEGASNSFHPPR